MADDPLRAPDDGRVRLPRIDNAMNKLPPIPKKGGKGSKDDSKNSRLGLEEDGGKKKGKSGLTAAEERKLLERVRKRFDRCCSSESENRKAGLDDLKFKAGDQWPAGIMASRQSEQRPCLTVNKILTFVHQITNDLRQNRPGIVINPTGDKGDPEVAKMYSGMVRAIHRDSHADIAYDTGAESAVSIGVGYWRILTDYEGPDTFDQVIRIVRIRNPFTVYLDPDHQEPDGHDAKYGFITTLLSKDDFQDAYPDAQWVQFTQTGLGDRLANWKDGENIRIAEYFEVEEKSRKLVALDTGHVGWEDELAGWIKRDIETGLVKVLNERESQDRTIAWYKLTALDVLEKKDWVGQEGVPIVKVIGDEIDIEGKVRLSGVVRHAKDPQRMFNYWRTLETELIALQPKAPWVMEEGQVEGHEDEWAAANRKSSPYLLYKGTNLSNGPAPPPQRQPFAAAPAGVEQAIQGAQQDMMATTGIRFDATPNERLIDESGKAIRELRRSGDMGSFHYVDNMARSLRRTGHILIDLIPKIYDRKRMITILRESDEEERIMIDPNSPKPMIEIPHGLDGKKLKVFNPTKGNYGVTVTIGPSYATKRIEAAENLMNFMKTVPTAAPLIMDLAAKELDFEGAQEMASRLAKAVPPQLLTPDQKDVPPQVQAVMQHQQMQIKQMQMEMQKLVQALTEKNSDRAITKDKINKDFEAKLLAIVQKAQAAQSKTEGSNLKDVVGGVTALMSLLNDGEGEQKEPETPQTPASIAMEQRIKELETRMKKPRKLKITRGADGRISDATAEYEDERKPAHKSTKH